MRYINSSWKVIDYSKKDLFLYEDGIYAYFNDIDGVKINQDPKVKINTNYPNPFDDYTYIEYQISSSTKVKLFIYDLKGRLVKRLVNRIIDNKYNRVKWQGRDKHGRKLASGVYYIVLKANGNKKIRKMVLLK